MKVWGKMLFYGLAFLCVQFRLLIALLFDPWYGIQPLPLYSYKHGVSRVSCL